MGTLSAYRDKEPTDYQKWFATYLVREVGLRPSDMTPKEAFITALRLALTCRNHYNDSDFLAEQREKYGVKKRGPKPKAAVIEEPEDDDFDDEDDAPDDDFDDTADDDDFDDTAADDADDFEEEQPAPKRRGRPATSGTARKAAPAKRASAKRTASSGTPKGRGKPKPTGDDFVW